MSCAPAGETCVTTCSFRNGVRTQAEHRKTTMEFFDNMVHSDFILCVRGGGNFSVRFYETLAMGRIPLFLDTDCLLPLSETSFWKEGVASTKNVDNLPETTSRKFLNVDKEDFLSLQKNIRTFWIDYLSLRAFFWQEFQMLSEKKD